MNPWHDPARVAERRRVFALAQQTKAGGFDYAAKPRMYRSEAVVMFFYPGQLDDFSSGRAVPIGLQRQPIVSWDFFTEAAADSAVQP